MKIVISITDRDMAKYATYEVESPELALELILKSDISLVTEVGAPNRDTSVIVRTFSEEETMQVLRRLCTSKDTTEHVLKTGEGT